VSNACAGSVIPETRRLGGFSLNTHGRIEAQGEIELKDGAKRRRTISAFTRVNALSGGAEGILDFNFSLCAAVYRAG
jgi:hypothetical protein